MSFSCIMCCRPNNKAGWFAFCLLADDVEDCCSSSNYSHTESRCACRVREFYR